LETFGALIRSLREERKLPIRKVAAQLDIDPSTLSKIERDDRTANRNCIGTLAAMFEVEENLLLIHLLSDKVVHDLISEKLFLEVLEIAQKKIEFVRSKNTVQSQIEFS